MTKYYCDKCGKELTYPPKSYYGNTKLGGKIIAVRIDVENDRSNTKVLLCQDCLLEIISKVDWH